MLNVFVHAAHSNSACGITRVYRGAADHSTRLPARLQPQQATAPRRAPPPPTPSGRQTKRRRVISACAASYIVLLSAHMHQRAHSMECCSGFSEFRARALSETSALSPNCARQEQNAPADYLFAPAAPRSCPVRNGNF
jgi:hypothetical protein